jgi:DNA-binding transcriptional LysR family regulator
MSSENIFGRCASAWWCLPPAHTAAACGYLRELIAACRAQLPEVDFSLMEMVSGDQLEALTSGQIDAGLLRPPSTVRNLQRGAFWPSRCLRRDHLFFRRV